MSRLIEAAREGDVVTVKRLLETPPLLGSSVNVNERNRHGNTPLLLAVQNNYPVVVRLILGKDEVEVNLTDKAGWSPLLIACFSNHIESARLLIADPRTDLNKRGYYGRSALHFACELGYDSILELLLQHDDRPIQVNLQDQSGCTPLLLAVMNRHTTLVKLLLCRKDVDLDLKDQEGMTVFDYAKRHAQTRNILSATQCARQCFTKLSTL